MRSSLIILAALAVLTVSCAKKEAPPAPPAPTDNPFFTEWTTPFGTPPFDKIRTAHYMPAFEAGHGRHQKEIAAASPIGRAADLRQHDRGPGAERRAPDQGRQRLQRLPPPTRATRCRRSRQEIAPLLSKHDDDIVLDAEALRAGQGRLGRQRTTAGPDARAGTPAREDLQRASSAAAPTSTRPRRPSSRTVNEELSVLALKFGQNVLKENNGFALVLDKPEDLAGLPAEPCGRRRPRRPRGARPGDGKWVFTLHKPILHPLPPVFGRRDLREKILPGLHQAGRQRQRRRQQGRRGQDRRPARRAGQPARLQDARRLRSRRDHGQDARRRLRPPGPDLAAGPGRGQGEAAELRGPDGQGRHRRPSSSPGTGGTTPRS